MQSATDRRKRSPEATATKNNQVMSEARIDLDPSSGRGNISDQFPGGSPVRRVRTRPNPCCCSCGARCRAAGGSFLFLRCDAQVRFASGQLCLLQILKDDLAGLSELRKRRVLRARMLSTGQLLLPSSSMLSRTRACSAVLVCTVRACTETPGSRSESWVDVPVRFFTCDAV